MARYRHIDTQPKFLSVDLARQLLPGTFEHAVRRGDAPITRVVLQRAVRTRLAPRARLSIRASVLGTHQWAGDTTAVDRRHRNSPLRSPGEESRYAC